MFKQNTSLIQTTEWIQIASALKPNMKRATITLPDELRDALEAYQRAQEVPLPLAAVTQSALREYLAKRGFLPSTEALRPFRITQTRRGVRRRKLARGTTGISPRQPKREEN